MSVDVKAVGTLEFESKRELAAVLEALADADDDDAAGEVLEAIEAGTSRDGTSLTVRVFASLTADASEVFQDWLESAVEAAADGQLDTWQESYGDSMFVRLFAGGTEEEIDEPFPDDD